MLRNLKASIPGAPKFTYGEFVKSDIATRKNIENNPNEEQWKCIELLARHVLQPVRDTFGPIKINSGFRSSKLNMLAGGSSNSSHCLGQAADIEPIDTSIKLISILEFIYTQLEFRELIAEYFPSGWVHVAYRHNYNHKQLKLKDDNHSYTIVSLDYVKSIYG